MSSCLIVIVLVPASLVADLMFGTALVAVGPVSVCEVVVALVVSLVVAIASMAGTIVDTRPVVVGVQ